MQPNYATRISPDFRVVTDSQVEEFIQAAFLILERTGVKITHPEALSLLAEAGADVRGDRVRVPRWMVQKALETTPRGLVLYSRDGRPVMPLTNGRSYYGTSTASPNNLDALTGERRPTTLQDIARGALVADALPNIDFVMPFGTAQDVPAKAGEVHEFVALMETTAKPVVFCGYSAKGVAKVLEMAAAVAGGREELKRRPFVVPYPEPITPLHFPDEVVSRMFVCCDFGVPQINSGAQLMTQTAPATLAGCVALATAESFFAITLNQLRKPGSPCFLTTSVGAVNHKTGSDCLASPEFCLTIAAQSQIARRLGLPTWGLAGATDSKALDAQAGAEAAIGILTQALAGVNVIHDVGYVDSGLSCSAAMMVLGDELISWTRHVMNGIEVSAETLAAEVIDQVGPGGNFLAHKHSIAHFRRESWFPNVFRKDQHDSWVNDGRPECRDVLYARTRRIIETHRPNPVNENLLAELRDMARAAERELLA